MSVPTVTPAAPRRAFTLTEMLVVIAIIAILVSLTSVGVMTAMARAKSTRIKTELDQIDMAMQSFKETYGSYPPCDLRIANATTLAQVRQFVATAFPRYNLSHLERDLKAALGVPFGDPITFRPDQALVLWLRGFSSDPMHPFVNRNDFPLNNGIAGGTKVQRKQPNFEFDTTRLVGISDTGAQDLIVLFSYFPQGRPADENGAPYVFWDYRSYGDFTVNPTDRETQFNTTNLSVGGVEPFANAGTAAPYAVDNDNDGTLEGWQQPDSFQLLSAGVDGKYGIKNAPLNVNARVFPSGAGYDTSNNMLDDDNATNFCDTAKIGDKKP